MRIFAFGPAWCRLASFSEKSAVAAKSVTSRKSARPTRQRARSMQQAGSPAHGAPTPAPKSGATEPYSRSPGGPLSPAEPLVRYLGGVIGWARLRSFELILSRAGVDVDRSGIVILTTLHRIGPMRMSDLAVDIGLDRSTISRQVAAVVRSGHVQKMNDSADARASLLTLTASGQAARKKLADAWHDIVLELVAEWTTEEQTQLGRLLGKLVIQMRADAD